MQMLRTIKKKLKTYLDAIIPRRINSDLIFSERIKNRHKIFWTPLNAEKIRNTIMRAGDPIENWRNVKNWQRRLSNKHNSREFAKKHNCRVAELYWKGRNLDEIKFGNLPKNYVIRPTTGHGCSLIFLMDDACNLMDGKMYTVEDIKEILAEALKKNKKLEFLFEEFLKTEGGLYKIPDDYKFYMFNGEIACIQVINRLAASKAFTTCYNENWQLIENVNTYYAKVEYQQPPKCLAEMSQKAKELSKSYEIFVRIDFYATDRGAAFGEFTPTPFKGLHFTLEADKLFTNYWDKFCTGKV